MQFLLPVKNPTDEITHVQVRVYHCKTRKAILASVFPAVIKGEIVQIVLNNFEFVNLVPMPRLRSKEVERFQETHKELLVRRTDGPVLDAAKKVAAKYGKELLSLLEMEEMKAKS